jgi:hypothetical protein
MENAPPVDLARPPFVVGDGSPAEVGNQIAAVYLGYGQHLPPATHFWQAVAQAVGVGIDSALMLAGQDLAADIDAGIGIGLLDGYHNIQHYIEVLLNTVHLILRNDAGAHDGIVFTAFEKQRLLFAALSHDFHYHRLSDEERRDGPVPFQLEEYAFVEARNYMIRHGVDETSIREVEIMILTTDVGPASKAGSFLCAAHLHLFEGGPKPEVTPVLERVAVVLAQPRLARMAAILRDADVLSSAGLNWEYLQLQNAKLGAETGASRGSRETRNFLRFIVHDRFTTEAARFFQPNLEAIKQQAETALADEA